MMWGYGHGWGMPFFGGGPIVVLAIVAGILYLLLREGGPLHGRFPGARSDSAREILDQRYARGELTKEQYDQTPRDLT